MKIIDAKIMEKIYFVPKTKQPPSWFDKLQMHMMMSKMKRELSKGKKYFEVSSFLTKHNKIELEMNGYNVEERRCGHYDSTVYYRVSIASYAAASYRAPNPVEGEEV